MNDTNTSSPSAGIDIEKKEVLYVRTTLCVLIIILCVISFATMLTAPKIALNIRYMCSNIIFYDFCVTIMYVLHYSFMDAPEWFYYRATQYGVMGQWFAVTAFTFERFLAIASPFMYRKYFKNSHVKRFVLIEFICFPAILLATVSIERESKRAIRVCWGAISIHAALSIVCLICIIKTLIIFKRSLTQVRMTESRFANNIRIISRSRENLSVVCIVFVVTHIPIEIETFALRCEFNPRVPLYSSFLLLVNCAVDPLLYVWRFRESRLQLLKVFSHFPCCRFLEKSVEARRIKIFNIPIAEHSVKHHKATSKGTDA